MNNLKATFAVICSLLMLSIGCIDFSGGGPGTDKIEIIAEEKSPNGKLIATSFSCSGGGAAGYFYFNASLRKAGEKLDQRDGLLGKHKTWKAFANIEVKWIDDENLEVSYNQFNSPDYRGIMPLRWNPNTASRFTTKSNKESDETD